MMRLEPRSSSSKSSRSSRPHRRRATAAVARLNLDCRARALPPSPDASLSTRRLAPLAPKTTPWRLGIAATPSPYPPPRIEHSCTTRGGFRGPFVPFPSSLIGGAAQSSHSQWRRPRGGLFEIPHRPIRGVGSFFRGLGFSTIGDRPRSV